MNGAMRMKSKTIGDQELALLQYVSGLGEATVGQAAEGFGTPRGLARSTVLTMMERLRAKGYLARRQVDGVFRYGARSTSGELLHGVVRDFVERTLGGSVSPFVAYLTETEEVSERELAELEKLVAKLQSKRKE
jgi:predicted transcriptional regulator